MKRELRVCVMIAVNQSRHKKPRDYTWLLLVCYYQFKKPVRVHVWRNTCCVHVSSWTTAQSDSPKEQFTDRIRRRSWIWIVKFLRGVHISAYKFTKSRINAPTHSLSHSIPSNNLQPYLQLSATATTSWLARCCNLYITHTYTCIYNQSRRKAGVEGVHIKTTLYNNKFFYVTISYWSVHLTFLIFF